MEREVVLTRCAVLVLGEDGIVRYTLKAGAVETVDDARDAIAAVVKLGKGKRLFRNSCG